MCFQLILARSHHIIFIAADLDIIRPQPPRLITTVAFTHQCCASHGWIFSRTPPLSLSLLLPPIHQKMCVRLRVCARARVANTTCEACNWVCPPTTWQYRQYNRRLHCPRHNGWIRPSHPFIQLAVESHHSVAAVECVVCPTTRHRESRSSVPRRR